MDDDFTPDEIKDFEAVSPEEKAAMERYAKWASKKASSGAPSGGPNNSNSGTNGGQSEPKASLSPSPSALGLSDILKLIEDDQTSSILEHLLAKKAELRKAGPKGGATPKPPAVSKLTRLLK